MKQVIFDSSFLMAVAENPTTWYEDIVGEVGRFQPVLLECVMQELAKIASGQGRRSRTARVALDLASGFVVLPCGKAGVDDEVVSAAVSTKSAVATVDEELLRTLKRLRVKAISLRANRVATT